MSGIPTTTVHDVADDALLIDVREHDEWEAGHAPNAIHIPLGELPVRLEEIPETDGPLGIVCRMGGRSARAVAWLAQQGFDVANVEGGMLEWHRAGKQITGTANPQII
ncbi:rhodanese [Intrasporangium oryzae NRRL B-24470]|uniref:Rhodanese n=1 Tax=Intrasporangium oryzae NRRL B-24470 TaxID=1386089 RepID=W9G4C1_9MICO|nr:rhodanese-like domain-containing protein [Intrasporangium oryzae]EWS99632.1 rhodanese [Intrasporangium oryzae NRRL B-24470]